VLVLYGILGENVVKTQIRWVCSFQLWCSLQNHRSEDGQGGEGGGGRGEEKKRFPRWTHKMQTQDSLQGPILSVAKSALRPREGLWW